MELICPSLEDYRLQHLKAGSTVGLLHGAECRPQHASAVGTGLRASPVGKRESNCWRLPKHSLVSENGQATTTRPPVHALDEMAFWKR